MSGLREFLEDAPAMLRQAEESVIQQRAAFEKVRYTGHGWTQWKQLREREAFLAFLKGEIAAAEKSNPGLVKAIKAQRKLAEAAA